MADQQDDRDTGKRSGKEKDPIVAEALERFKWVAEVEDAQRKAILDCKKFRAGDQWPSDIKVTRSGGVGHQGQAEQPSRPMLTIDRISQPTRQVSNSVKAANFAINVQPNGHGADDETANVIKGLLRWIQNRARAEAPVDWAADQAAEGGIGWFRIRSEFCDVDLDSTDFTHAFDQDLVLERVTNNLTVYSDPDAKKPTKRDARFMMVTEDLPRGEFKRKWPKANVISLDEFMSTGDNAALYGGEWVSDKTIRIAEYWKVEQVEAWLVEVQPTPEQPAVVMREDQLPEGTPKEAILRRRKVFTPQVTCYIINAVEVLEQYDWLGRRIPLFPIIGEELNVDGKQVLRGIIQPAMDAQRMVNFMYSGAIETVALAPKAPLIVAEGQVERYKQLWQNANRFNYAYLPYTPVSLLGQPVPPPQRDQAEAPIQAMVMMLEKSEEAIKFTTGIFDPSLGNARPNEKSGRAIEALQRQSELGQSNYIDNVITTLTDAGDELVYLLPRYYDRPGRVQQILGIDDKPEQVMLGVPFQQGKQGPQPAPGVTPEQARAEKGMVKFYDLKAGRYAVTVAVGKSHTTKRSEGSAVIGEMVAKNPQLLQILGDLYFRDLDFYGAQEIAERMKKMLAPEIRDEGKDGEPNPQQLQQQLEQLGKLVEMMKGELDEKTKLIETDAVKAQKDVELAQAKANADLQLQTLKEQAESERQQEELAAKIHIEKLKLVADILKTRATLEAQQTEAMIDAEIRQLDTQVAAAGDAEERESVSQESERDRQFQSQEAAQARQHESDEGERARQHEATQAEREAARSTEEE